MPRLNSQLTLSVSDSAAANSPAPSHLPAFSQLPAVAQLAEQADVSTCIGKAGRYDGG